MFNNKPYLIAEIGSNHDGYLKRGYKTIISAKKSGANAVKFQSWDTTLYNDSYWEKNKKDFLASKKVSADFCFLKKMNFFSKKNKIDFSSTPFNEKQLKELITLNPSFIKIASMDIDNLEFIDMCAKLKHTVLISTGTANLKEIKEAENIFIKRKKKNVIFMHCVSLYPPKENELNLHKIKILQDELRYEVGFSDHSLGNFASVVAMSMGVRVIEKHFTINKNLKGYDHSFAADKKDFEEIVLNQKKILSMIGSNKIQNDREQNSKKAMRRSAFSNKILLKNNKILRSDISFQRPGDGLGFKKMNNIIGKKLKVKIEKNTKIKRNFFIL
jgi:sialic acid synthase SpsE